MANMRKCQIDMTGMVFGYLTVTQYSHSKHTKHFWVCTCICNAKKISCRFDLLNGTATTCGCTNKCSEANLVGKRFGKLTVTGQYLESTTVKYPYSCTCDCGKVKIFNAYNLIYRDNQSCGCQNGVNRKIPGASISPGKKTVEYSCWSALRHRCRNKNLKSYKDYGGRGISVCPEWIDSFSQFFLDMGNRPSPSHSLDRIDCNGNYSKENCRWATKKEQTDNRSSTIWIEYKNIRMVKTDFCVLIGTTRGTVTNRINKGWSIDKIADYYINHKTQKNSKNR